MKELEKRTMRTIEQCLSIVRYIRGEAEQYRISKISGVRELLKSVRDIETELIATSHKLRIPIISITSKFDIIEINLTILAKSMDDYPLTLEQRNYFLLDIVNLADDILTEAQNLLANSAHIDK